MNFNGWLLLTAFVDWKGTLRSENPRATCRCPACSRDVHSVGSENNSYRYKGTSHHADCVVARETDSKCNLHPVLVD